VTFERKLAQVFSLSDENWMKHANPISVWTRYTVLPIIALSVWSRLWIGWWCLIPLLISIGWMFINPIFFDKPTSTKNWASKAVLGERVYLNRDNIDIPDQHKTLLYTVLNLISFFGLMLAIWGMVVYSVWGAAVGVAITMLGKSWFLDRMVWLYEDMKGKDETYKSWEY